MFQVALFSGHTVDSPFFFLDDSILGAGRGGGSVYRPLNTRYMGEQGLWLDERQCLVVQKQTHTTTTTKQAFLSLFLGGATVTAYVPLRGMSPNLDMVNASLAEQLPSCLFPHLAVAAGYSTV